MSSGVVSHRVEFLVDLFLNDDPDLIEDVQGPYDAEGCDEGHDGDMVVEYSDDEEFLRKKVGREFRDSGDEILKRYSAIKHRSLSNDVKDIFKEKGARTENMWSTFLEVIDGAIRTTDLDDPTKILAALLVTVKGFGNLGGGVRDFTLRYIRERNLDADFKKMAAKNTANALD